MTTRNDIIAELTGPGGQFETTTETVGGHEMRVYAQRFGSLADVAAFGAVHGDAEFIVYGDERHTFTDFLADVNRMAHALRALGVEKGDRVAVLAANNPEWCCSFWATVSIGAVLVGLNGWWKTEEIVYGLDDSGAKVLIGDHQRLVRVADELAAIEGLEHTFLIDAEEAPDAIAGTRPFDELLAGDDTSTPVADITEDDAAVIFYTSGTTGRPKGAISTHRNMIANLQNTVFLLTVNRLVDEAEGPVDDSGENGENGDTGRPSALFSSPLFHVAGCHSTLVVGLMGGLRLVMIKGRFTPELALGLIEEEGVSIWSAVPTMIWRVCEYPDRHRYDTSTITSVSFGGSPSAEELQRRIRETFPNVKATANAYGLTETSSVATVLSGDDALDRPDSVGPPMPVVDVAIAGPDGRHLGPGETGEVYIRGPIVIPGYWNKPEATAEAIVDGWLHTGDVGYLDDDGYLYITDRAKDMIIRGGENVYCVEIENRLVEHPAIADAAIVGVPHRELGEEVKAVIELAPGAEISDAEVRQWVADALADFNVPAHIDRHDGKLPRNASGKLLKNVLRGTGEVSFAETM